LCCQKVDLPSIAHIIATDDLIAVPRNFRFMGELVT